jgi:hypothetical protein
MQASRKQGFYSLRRPSLFESIQKSAEDKATRRSMKLRFPKKMQGKEMETNEDPEPTDNYHNQMPDNNELGKYSVLK